MSENVLSIQILDCVMSGVYPDTKAFIFMRVLYPTEHHTKLPSDIEILYNDKMLRFLCGSVYIIIKTGLKVV